MEILTRTINIINRCTNLYRDTQLDDTSLSGCQVPYILRICRSAGGKPRRSWRKAFMFTRAALPESWLPWRQTAGLPAPLVPRIAVPCGSIPRPRRRQSFHSCIRCLRNGATILLPAFPPRKRIPCSRCSTVWRTALRHGPRKGGRTDAHSLSVYRQLSTRIGLTMVIKIGGTVIELYLPWLLPPYWMTVPPWVISRR